MGATRSDVRDGVARDARMLAELDFQIKDNHRLTAENEELRVQLGVLWELFGKHAAVEPCDLPEIDAVRQRLCELGVELPVGGVMPIPRGNGKNLMHEKVVRCRDCSGRMSERVTIDQDWVRGLIERNSAEWGGNRREFYNSAYQVISEEIRALMDDYAMAQSAELRDVARKMLRGFVNCDIELRRHGKTFLPERYVVRLRSLGVEV